MGKCFNADGPSSFALNRLSAGFPLRLELPMLVLASHVTDSEHAATTRTLRAWAATKDPRLTTNRRGE